MYILAGWLGLTEQWPLCPDQFAPYMDKQIFVGNILLVELLMFLLLNKLI